MSSRETLPRLPWATHSAPSGAEMTRSLKPPGIRWALVNVPSKVMRDTTPLMNSEM